MIEPIRLVLEVACPAEHAFELWTEQTASWWPVEHSFTAVPGLRVVFERRLGGRIFERTPEGEEWEWGEITAWEPPRRVAYLWHLAAERADATDVEVTFDDQGDGTTRVEIVHGGWERLGARGEPWRDRNQAGWAGVVPSYIEACARWGPT